MLAALLSIDAHAVTGLWSGCHYTGRGRAETTDIYRGQQVAPDLIPKVRLDIACNDEFKQITIDAILSAARTNGGEVGDGKIFVTHLEECIRIRTGESGNEAI